MTVPTLRSDRLNLRGLSAQDALVIASALNDYAISKWLTRVPYPYKLTDAEWFIAENLAGRLVAWMIHAGDRFVGVVGMDQELGYWLVPEAWGHGYATEASHTVLTHFFASTEKDAARSSHHADNRASQNVLTKLGFVDCGPCIHRSQARQADVDARKMILRRADWALDENGHSSDSTMKKLTHPAR